MPKFADDITRKIDELKLSRAAIPTKFRQLTEILNKNYAVTAMSKLNRKAANYYLNLKNTMHTYLGTMLGGTTTTIFNANKKPRFTFNESPDGKLSVYYITSTVGNEKPKWPTNLQPYLVDQLKTYKKTGYFEGEKPPTGLRNLLDRLYFKIVGGCKSGGHLPVILLTAVVNSAHCDVSYNVAQIVEDGEHPTVKISDQTGKHDKSFDDVKLLAPPKSAYEWRNSPGKAYSSIHLKEYKDGEAWLKNDGAPVPKQIADKLSGRYYKNFDEFRKDFWKEVAKDPVLSKQFTKGNLITMSKGNAPAAPLSEQVGGRIKFELDHNHEIQDGGLVYDLGNRCLST